MPPRKAPAQKGLSAARAFLPLSAGIVLCGAVIFLLGFSNLFPVEYVRAIDDLPLQPSWPAKLDTNAYNLRMLSLAHIDVASTSFALGISTTTVIATGTIPVAWTASTSVSVFGRNWPHGAAYPYGDAIFPWKRIVAYYGNFYSKQMGVLGEYPQDEVLAKLASTTAAWQAADPSTPTIPAIQYIAVVAQGSAGKDGKWRARMPDEEIEKALAMANQMHGLLILDVQVGLST
ncbi:MAG TPA: hypothetical protein VMT80_02525, partial [Candidatus Paceibacterota bacterium]|nr:hypothetical protein [Candidatus Paceibacterota bacterium]